MQYRADNSYAASTESSTIYDILQIREITVKKRETLQSYVFQGILLFVLLMLTGCMQQSIPIYYYTLNSTDARTVAAIRPGIPLFIGPIHINSFLDQGQIITRNSRNSVNIEEQQRWAGDLRQMISDVLICNIGQKLGTNTVFRFTGGSSQGGLQIEIDILHFEKSSNGDAHLTARWKILSMQDGSILHSSSSDYKTVPGSDRTEALTAALSHGLELLSREISSTIKTLSSQ